MSDDYIVGEPSHLSVAIFDADDVPSDPELLRLRIMPPRPAAVQTYTFGTDAEIVRDGIGLFHADISLPMPGTWYYRWEAGNPVTGVGEGDLRVRPSRFEVTS